MKTLEFHLCYTEDMPDKEGWSTWARFLQHWGMKEPVAAILEAAGPLAIFIAQVIYFGQPLLQWVIPNGEWTVLADTLEDQNERLTFVSYLRSEEII